MKNIVKIKRICFVVLLLMLSTSAFAQKININGIVLDSLFSEPLPFSVLTVIDRDSDQEIFNGLINSSDGSFQFKDIDTQGKSAVVRIRYMGYKDKFMPLNESLGVISLQPNTIEIGEVTVVGTIPIRQTVDRAIYSPDGLDYSKISVSSDLLRQIPELAVDELLRKVSIKGSANTLVMVNGINTGTSVDIRTIDFRNIAQVEVITTPSSGLESQYDGVVNIITMKRNQTGFTADLEQTTMLNLNSNDTYVGLAWGGERVNLKFTYSNYYRANPFEIGERRYDANSLFYQDGVSASPQETTNELGLNLDYHISPNDFFNLSTSTQFVHADKSIDYITSDLNDFTAQFLNKYFIGNYTLYYRHTMTNKPADYISINANIGVMSAKEESGSTYKNGANFINNEVADKFSTNIRIEYNNQLTSRLKLNTGGKLLYQDFYSKLNSNLSDNNYFNLQSNIYADLFFMANNWQFRVGVKGEFNHNDFDNPAYQNTTQYQLQPTVMMLYKLNKEHSLQIEYRRVLGYPSSWMLTTYTTQVNEKTSFVGNPKLLLSSNDIVDINYMYRGDIATFNINPFYQYSSNIITTQTTFDNNLNSTTTYINGGYINRVGLLINGSINLLQGAISIDPDMYVGYDNTISPDLVQYNFSYRLGGAVNLYFPYGFGVGAYGSYRSKYLKINGYSQPRYALDAIYILKRFEKIGLNLFVGYQNIVQSADVDFIVNNNYTQRDYFKFDAKSFIFRLNYYFNNGKRIKSERVKTYYDKDRK